MSRINVPARFREDRNPQIVTGNYGWRIHPTHKTKDFHTGTDYRSASGTRLVAPVDGVVTLAKLYTTGYGGRVLIYHADTDTTVYVTHLEALYVKTGDYVSKGQLIALSGGDENKDKYAGSSRGAHLHIGIIKGRKTSIPGKQDKYFYDPEKFDWSRYDVKPIEETGVFEVLSDSLRKRTQANRNSEIKGSHKKGAKLKYISKVVNDGHVWYKFEDGTYSASGTIAKPNEFAKITIDDNGPAIGKSYRINSSLFTSSNASKKGTTVHNNKVAEIVNIVKNAKAPYLLKGSGLSGWANDEILQGKITSKPLPKELKVGDKVEVLKAIVFDTGKKFTKWRKSYDVISVNGNRVVIGVGKKITAPVHKDHLRKIN